MKNSLVNLVRLGELTEAEAHALAGTMHQPKAHRPAWWTTAKVTVFIAGLLIGVFLANVWALGQKAHREHLQSLVEEQR